MDTSEETESKMIKNASAWARYLRRLDLYVMADATVGASQIDDQGDNKRVRKEIRREPKHTRDCLHTRFGDLQLLASGAALSAGAEEFATRPSL